MIKAIQLEIAERRENWPNLVMFNTYVKGNPWECDILSVKPSLFYTEYEIKLTLADFRADFKKGQYGFKKHDMYASDDTIKMATVYNNPRLKRIYPKPKQFYFVAPKGVISSSLIPSHCGFIEIIQVPKGVRSTIVKLAPFLKSPTKLDISNIYNLARKAARRCRN